VQACTPRQTSAVDSRVFKRVPATARLKSGVRLVACTVFVVEDDVDTRDMLGRFLELEGFRVEVACNGQQALDRLSAGVSPCVILLDLMMPVMDGWQFREQQARDTAISKIPVIVVSAAGTDRISGVAANAYLSKPVDLDQLLERVTQYCPH
jgi:CheY-like chemotaxis protein